MKLFPAFKFCFWAVVGLIRFGESYNSTTPDTISSAVDTSATTLQQEVTESLATSQSLSANATEPPPPPPPPPPKTTTVETSLGNSSTPLNNGTDAKVDLIGSLSQQVRDILKHFQTPDPLDLPGQALLEDPLVVPNVNINLGIATGDFYNITVHGLSNFTLDGVNAVLDQMEINTLIIIKIVYIAGNCTFDTMFGLKSQGPFNITLTNVTADGTVFLDVKPDGTLLANKTVTDIAYDDLTFTASSDVILQSALSRAGVAVLTALKPHILKQIDVCVTEEVNKQLKHAPKMPAIVDRSPIDLAIMEGRRFVAQHYEPFVIEKIVEHDSQFLVLSVGPVTIRGLSKFSRMGSITMQMYNGTVIVGLRLVTGALRGSCRFYYDFGRIGVTRDGQAYFSVTHLQFEATVTQSINLRRKPVLEDLQLETGKISVHLDGGGRLDYVVELAMELLPQMLRHLIIDALEEPIKQMIQTEVFDKLNVEELVERQLPLVESLLFAGM